MSLSWKWGSCWYIGGKSWVACIIRGYLGRVIEPLLRRSQVIAILCRGFGDHGGNLAKQRGSVRVLIRLFWGWLGCWCFVSGGSRGDVSLIEMASALVLRISVNELFEDIRLSKRLLICKRKVLTTIRGANPVVGRGGSLDHALVYEASVSHQDLSTEA